MKKFSWYVYVSELWIEIMIEKIKNEVKLLMSADNDGHGFDHVERVYNMAIKLAEKEQADSKIVAMAALLHDVDDYKLFGEENAQNLTNAKKILSGCNLDDNRVDRVCHIIQNMGYSNSLKGIRPQTIEGKVVSDADMLDAIGANGIIRTLAYTLTVGNKRVFDSTAFPQKKLSVQEYKDKNRSDDNCINHFFDKLLKLKNMMLTQSGYKTAIIRHQIMVDFLYAFFEEQGCDNWVKYLEDYEQLQAQVPLQIRQTA